MTHLPGDDVAGPRAAPVDVPAPTASRWTPRRPLRIVSPRGQLLTIVIAGVVIVATGLLIVLLAASWVAAPTMLALGVATVVLCARAFRGPSEDPVAARPWWRMTERAPAGYMLAALFLAQAVWYVAMPGSVPAVEVAVLVVAALVAAAYVHSSIRLGRSTAAAPAEAAPEG